MKRSDCWNCREMMDVGKWVGYWCGLRGIFPCVCLCVCQDFGKKLLDLKTAMDSHISKVVVRQSIMPISPTTGQGGPDGTEGGVWEDIAAAATGVCVHVCAHLVYVRACLSCYVCVCSSHVYVCVCSSRVYVCVCSCECMCVHGVLIGCLHCRSTAWRLERVQKDSCASQRRLLVAPANRLGLNFLPIILFFYAQGLVYYSSMSAAHYSKFMLVKASQKKNLCSRWGLKQ